MTNSQPDPLAAARATQLNRNLAAGVRRHTIVMIPDGCHIMIPAELSAIVADLRFVRIGDSNNITPLPMQNVATSTIPVADYVLTELDNAYFNQQPGESK